MLECNPIIRINFPILKSTVKDVLHHVRTNIKLCQTCMRDFLTYQKKTVINLISIMHLYTFSNNYTKNETKENIPTHQSGLGPIIVSIDTR